MVIINTHRKYRIILAFILLAILIIRSPLSAEKRQVLFIVHTSDVHGRIEPRPEMKRLFGKKLAGGYPTLKTYLDKLKSSASKEDGNVIYLDSGDYFQGTPAVDKTRGECMITLMNKVGLAAATIGNHDFDYGLRNLESQLERAEFKVVCANVFIKGTNNLLKNVEPYTVLDVGGLKIGVIGILTPDTIRISLENNVSKIEIQDPLPIVKDAVQALKAKNVNLIVLLSHMGFEDDLDLAMNITDVDLILGGHTHTTLDKIVWAGDSNVAVVHSGTNNEGVSEIRVEFENGKPADISMKRVELYSDLYSLDIETGKIVSSYLKQVETEMEKILGETRVDLFRGVLGGDSPEGSFMADAMKECTGADFAFMNFGGIRSSLIKGPISMNDVFLLMPFDNTIDVFTMTGEQVRNLIEKSLSPAFLPVDKAAVDFAKRNYRLIPSGVKRQMGGAYGYLVPSNLRIRFDPQNPPMKRILEIERLDGKPFLLQENYRVALNSYVSQGGDGFSFLKTDFNVERTPFLLRDAIVLKIRRDKVIKSVPEPRMINLRLRVIEAGKADFDDK